ncbi:zf-C3HC4-domain-containing protein [Sanghuangporus baumii]|uniref:Zf-C3HC4-domain-containing protein n=1 Tax=Sanghuangporus baumii TaxID=108892 RepID=A0A9Q5HZJ9_SANBA|nr:zf-C3HC4-domain-containing protein [Sanghuangporus baumii]
MRTMRTKTNVNAEYALMVQKVVGSFVLAIVEDPLRIYMSNVCNDGVGNLNPLSTGAHNVTIRTARTSVLGLAENPVIIASLSVFLFTCLAYIASFIVTFFMSEDYTPRSTFFFFGWNWVTPDEVAYNLMRVVLRILRDEDIIIDENTLRSPLRAAPTKPTTPQKLGNFAKFIHRIIIGVPVLGVASLVQLFWSMSFLGPVNLLARRLGRARNRRESSRDIATLIILGAIILGALRALRGVYRLTERAVRWGLTRTEDLILEVQ